MGNMVVYCINQRIEQVTGASLHIQLPFLKKKKKKKKNTCFRLHSFADVKNIFIQLSMKLMLIFVEMTNTLLSR